MSERRWSRSPSQITTYETCPKRFEWQYLKRMRVVGSWGVKGRAVHQALAHSYTQKIDSGEDRPIGEVLEVFHEAVRRAFSPLGQSEELIVLFEDESEAQIRAIGAAQLDVYMREIAPTIQPLMVEEPVSMTLPSGLRLKGIVDLIDDAMRIRDSKFPTNKLSQNAVRYQAQPPLYAAMVQARTGAWPTFVYDAVPSGRAKVVKPQVQRGLEWRITPEFVAARLRDVELIDAQIQAGVFPRRPSEQNCSKCLFKHACWWGVLPPEAETEPTQPDLIPALESSLAAVGAEP